MNYYNIYVKNNCDFYNEILPFAIKVNETVGCVMIEFNDTQIDKIRKKLNFEKLNKYLFVGNDNLVYSMTLDSFICTNERVKRNLINKNYHIICRHLSTMKKNSDKALSWLNNSNKTHIEKSNTTLLGFKGYRYVNKENEFAFPFRFKNSSSKEKKPLVIFLHGAGAIGTDNIKQIFDGITVLWKLKNKKCSILLPQEPSKTTTPYWNSLEILIDELIAENKNIDKKKIYLVGTSWGGYCVWNMIYNHPNKFACAIPVMGTLDENSYKDFDLSQIKDIPLWVAHSSNDTNVKIDSDDYCVSELKKLNADITYTRWNKYGHNMYNHFYLQESWCDWMFSKELI